MCQWMNWKTNCTSIFNRTFSLDSLNGFVLIISRYCHWTSKRTVKCHWIGPARKNVTNHLMFVIHQLVIFELIYLSKYWFFIWYTSEQARDLEDAIVMGAVSQPGEIALDIFCHLMETLKRGDEDIWNILYSGYIPFVLKLGNYAIPTCDMVLASCKMMS